MNFNQIFNEESNETVTRRSFLIWVHLKLIYKLHSVTFCGLVNPEQDI